MAETSRQRAGSWTVYLLRCADTSLYCGIARDVEARVAAHNSGRGARYTRGRAPVVVVASRRVRSQGLALRLEAAVKRLSRGAKLRLIADPSEWRTVTGRRKRTSRRTSS